MAKKQTPHAQEQDLLIKLLSFQDDPLAFVYYAFPWGQANSPLENSQGPREWQVEALTKIRDHLKANQHKHAQDLTPELLKMARASGRGIGKSAFVAWVALWMFSCIPSSTVIVSANTGCIWSVAQGFFTDKTVHRVWLAISNPRNPSGEFFECFHGNRDQWDTDSIDGRSVAENDHQLYDNIIQQYGADSDQDRVEVHGQFPRHSVRALQELQHH